MATVNLASLGSEKLRYLDQALSRVLSMRLVEETLGQIVDGMPTETSYNRMKMTTGCWREEMRGRTSPSEASIFTVRQFRERLDLSKLGIDTKTAQAYQNSLLDSPDFYITLLGAVAVSIHNLAVRIFKDLHGFSRYDPVPILYHPHFQNTAEYPEGSAQMVGYWAETEIFGGVVVFDRTGSERKFQGVYLYPPRPQSLFSLSSSQLTRFAALRQSDQTGAMNGSSLVLPFTPEPGARLVRPYNAYSLGLYRNDYDLVPPGKGPTQLKCIIRPEDDPHYAYLVELAKKTAACTPGQISKPSIEDDAGGKG